MYKIVLVEDEAGIRNTLLQLFDWEALGCKAVGASSGLDALNMCLHSPPDIVITDIVMPGIDGITLTRYLKHEFPDIRFIIITSHREFDYAKESLDMGVQAFLLKPIDEEELRASILRAIESIQASSGQADKISKDELEEKYLANLLNGYLLNPESHLNAPGNPLRSLAHFVVAIMKFDNVENVSVINQHRLYNFCKTVNSQFEIRCARIDEYVAFVCPVRPDQGWREETQRFFASMLRYINETLHVTVSVGISAVADSLQGASKCYIQAVYAVRCKFFTGKESILYYDDVSGAASDPQIYLDNSFVKSLDNLLRTGTADLLELQIDTFFDQLLQSRPMDVDQCRSEMLCMLVMCFDRLTSNDPPNQAIFLQKYNFFRSILSAETLEEIKNLFISILLDLKNYRTTKTVTDRQFIVDKVMKYLEAHYSETVTLSDVAKDVYLSPAYLSTLISSETGNTLIDILNSLRIRKAIKLMEQSSMKNYQIAERVGFKEPQYFSVVFKKYTGLSPSEYRQLYFSN